MERWGGEEFLVVLPETDRLRDGASLEDAIARADAAIYRGKVDGRNRSTAEIQPEI